MCVCVCVKEKVGTARDKLFNMIFLYCGERQAEPHFLDYDLYYEMLIKCFPKISLILIK